MPTYEYRCDSCSHEFEAFQSMKDDPLTACPACGTDALRRLISGGTGVIFRGSGFYVTDSKGSVGSTKRPSSDTAATDSESTPKTDGASSGGGSEGGSTASTTPTAGGTGASKAVADRA